jgi:hypothetical protein
LVIVNLNYSLKGKATVNFEIEKVKIKLAVTVHTCNSSFLEDTDQENQGLRPAQAKSYQDHI